MLGALSGCRMEPGLCCYQTGPCIPEQIANQSPSTLRTLQTQWLVLVPLSLQLLHEDILSSAPWLRSAQLQMFWLHENHSVCLHVCVGTGFGVKQNLAFAVHSPLQCKTLGKHVVNVRGGKKRQSTEADERERKRSAKLGAKCHKTSEN